MRIKSRKTGNEQVITTDTWNSMGDLQSKFTIVSTEEQPLVNYAVPVIAQPPGVDNSMDFSIEEVLAKLQLMKTAEEREVFTRDETRGKIKRELKKLNK